MLLLLIILLGKASGDNEHSASVAAFCAKSEDNEFIASFAAFWTRSRDNECGASLAAICIESHIPTMQSTPFMKFVMGKSSSLHPLMNANPSSGSSSSTVNPSEFQAAANASVHDSEQGLLALPTPEEERGKRPLVQLSFKKATDWLLSFNLKQKKRRIAALPDEVVVRRKLIEEYTALVLKDWTPSITGRQLQSGSSAEDKFLIVTHCLGNEATNTFMTRAVPSRAYIDWGETKLLSLEDAEGEISDPTWETGFWLPTEQKAYDYAQSTKPATAARMFLEMINFLVSCFGFEFIDIRRSSRLTGYASIRLGALGFPRKAAVFVDILIPKLEFAVSCTEIPKELRLVCGNMLVNFRICHSVMAWPITTQITKNKSHSYE